MPSKRTKVRAHFRDELREKMKKRLFVHVEDGGALINIYTGEVFYNVRALPEEFHGRPEAFKVFEPEKGERDANDKDIVKDRTSLAQMES